MTTKTRKRVTKREAEQVLKAVRRKFAAWIGDGCEYSIQGPTLIMDWDWLGYGPVPSIVWEEGPYEWAINILDAFTDEDLSNNEFGFTVKTNGIKLPETVWTEPMTSWALSIYPQESIQATLAKATARRVTVQSYYGESVVLLDDKTVVATFKSIVFSEHSADAEAYADTIRDRLSS